MCLRLPSDAAVCIRRWRITAGWSASRAQDTAKASLIALEQNSKYYSTLILFSPVLCMYFAARVGAILLKGVSEYIHHLTMVIHVRCPGFPRVELCAV